MKIKIIIFSLFLSASFFWLLNSQVYSSFSNIAVYWDKMVALVPGAQAKKIKWENLPQEYKEKINTAQPRTSLDIFNSGITNPFGTHTVILREFALSAPDQVSVDNAMKLISEAGFTWVKDYLKGSNSISTNTPQYERVKWFLDAAKKYKLRVMVRIDGDNNADPESWSKYASSVVTNLGEYVFDWEIGNEPDLWNKGNGPTGTVSPDVYAKGVRAVYSAIKNTQSNSIIYGPATSNFGVLYPVGYEPCASSSKEGNYFDGYLKNLLKPENNFLGNIDVFSFHDYRPNVSPEGPSAGCASGNVYKSDYLEQVALLRKTIGKKDIAATESGYPLSKFSGDLNYKMSKQAKYEMRSQILAFATGQNPRINYTFSMYKDDQVSGYEESFGITSNNKGKPVVYTPRPAYYAARNVNALFDSTLKKTGKSFNLVSENKNFPINNKDITKFVFERSGSDTKELVLVFWKNKEGEGPLVDLVFPSLEYVAPVYIDLYNGGQKEPPVPVGLDYKVANGKIVISDIKIKDSPIIVILSNKNVVSKFKFTPSDSLGG